MQALLFAERSAILLAVHCQEFVVNEDAFAQVLLFAQGLCCN